MRPALAGLLLVASAFACSHGAPTRPAPPDADAPAGVSPAGGAGLPTLPDASTSSDAAPAATGPTPTSGDCARIFGRGAASEWVSYGPDGKLRYKAINEQGDRIMDFSGAGYRGGGV